VSEENDLNTVIDSPSPQLYTQNGGDWAKGEARRSELQLTWPNSFTKLPRVSVLARWCSASG